MAKVLVGGKKASGIRSSDVWNAGLFAKTYGEEIRYCPQSGKWLIRDKSHWRNDSAERVISLAMDLAESCYAEWRADGADATQFSKLYRLNSARGIRAMLDLAKTRPEMVVEANELDSDPFVLATKSGLLDLRTCELAPDYDGGICTRAIPVDFDPDAKCERWLAFIDELTCGDVELAEFIQRAVGYSLTGDTREQRFFFLYGIGCNGKSTFIQLLETLLGSYAVGTPAKTLLDQRTDAIPNDLARLRGARVVVASEIPQGSKINEARIKDLTGGDTVTARFLHREYFDYRPNFKLWMYGNHQPQIRGGDLGIWRRVACIPCEAVISDGSRDSQLVGRLRAELPGILNWALVGYRQWRDGGLGSAEAVTRASLEYRQEMDHIEQFLNIATQRIPGSTVQASDIYDAYKTWCKDAGRYPESQTQFGKYLSGRDYLTKVKSRGNQFYKGICISGQDGDSCRG